MFSGYWNVFLHSPFDWFIAGLGVICVGSHLYFIQINQDHAWRATWSERLRNICELFPLLGLVGTVLGLLSTLKSIQGEALDVHTVIGNFAPALSTTVTGILCLAVNIIFNIWLESTIQGD